jgi:pimeloyl-ACP methyl ester carboxylesterase
MDLRARATDHTRAPNPMNGIEHLPRDSETPTFAHDLSSATAVLGRVYVAAHFSGPAGPVAMRMTSGIAELARTYPDGIGIFLLLKSGARPPDADERKPMIAMLQRHRAQIKAFAVLMEGSGFWAAAARSVLTILSHSISFPLKVFATESDAIPWQSVEMRRLTPGEIDSPAMFTMVDQLRSFVADSRREKTL